MKSTNIKNEQVKKVECNFYDDNLKKNMDVIIICDNKKLYIIISNGITTEVKEYGRIEDLVKDYIKSENKKLLYAQKIKELKVEMDEMYKFKSL